MMELRPTVLIGTIVDFEDHYCTYTVQIDDMGLDYDEPNRCVGIGKVLTALDVNAHSCDEAAAAVGRKVRITLEVIDERRDSDEAE